jgi:ribosomal protein S18 acetylase RimI-like enzyme
MEIRKARIKDVKQIVELWKHLFRFHEDFDEFWVVNRSKNIERMFREWTKEKIRGKNSIVLVAIDGDKVVGYLLGYIKKRAPIFKAERVGYFSECFIDEKYRKKGIARMMVKEFIKWAKSKKLKWLELQASDKNETAIKVWNKIGFKTYSKDMFMKI